MANDFERLEQDGQIAWRCRKCEEIFICSVMPIGHFCQPTQDHRITAIPRVEEMQRSALSGFWQQVQLPQNPFYQPLSPLCQVHKAFILQKSQMENIMREQYIQQQDQLKHQQEQQQRIMVAAAVSKSTTGKRETDREERAGISSSNETLGDDENRETDDTKIKVSNMGQK